MTSSFVTCEEDTGGQGHTFDKMGLIKKSKKKVIMDIVNQEEINKMDTRCCGGWTKFVSVPIILPSELRTHDVFNGKMTVSQTNIYYILLLAKSDIVMWLFC